MLTKQDLGTDVWVRRVKLEGVSFFNDGGKVALLSIPPESAQYMHKDRTYRGALLSVVIMFAEEEWWMRKMEVAKTSGAPCQPTLFFTDTA